jgi:hypothetical protein
VAELEEIELAQRLRFRRLGGLHWKRRCANLAKVASASRSHGTFSVRRRRSNLPDAIGEHLQRAEPARATPSRARGRIAAVEPSKRTCGHHAHQQNAHTHGGDVIGGTQIEISHAGDEQVGDDEVRKAPEHVNRRG